jgi:hypothetical protein
VLLTSSPRACLHNVFLHAGGRRRPEPPIGGTLVQVDDPSGIDPEREIALEPEPGPRSRSLFEWMFRNRRTGHITIAQFPNLALWTFLATVVVRWALPTRGEAHTTVDAVAVAALAAWAVDEVLRGVNPWRRLLGIGGLYFVAAGVVALLR